MTKLTPEQLTEIEATAPEEGYHSVLALLAHIEALNAELLAALNKEEEERRAAAVWRENYEHSVKVVEAAKEMNKACLEVVREKFAAAASWAGDARIVQSWTALQDALKALGEGGR